MNYRRKWEIHHKTKIPHGYEIHHIDGDHSNNHIDNLECLSVREHYERHLSQGDACVILFHERLNISEEERVNNIKFTTGANNHMFGVQREDVTSRNIKSAGIKWYNNGFAEIRSFVQQEGWVEGRLPVKHESRIKISNSKKGKPTWNKGKKTGKNGLKWYNNGDREIKCSESPGDDWKHGRIYRERPDARKQILEMNKVKSYVKGRKWYNNGKENKMCFEHPGNEWKEGRLK